MGKEISVSESVVSLIEENKRDFFRYLTKVFNSENKLFVKGNLLDILISFREEDEEGNHGAIEEILKKTTESVCFGN